MMDGYQRANLASMPGFYSYTFLRTPLGSLMILESQDQFNISSERLSWLLVELSLLASLTPKKKHSFLKEASHPHTNQTHPCFA